MKSIRLMFEYQTTGTHLISYSALRFCLLMPERSCGWGQGGGTSACQSFIGGWGPCVWGRCHLRRAAPCRPSRAGRTLPLGTLRCCAFWAWCGGRSRPRAPGPGLLAWGSCDAPTALPSVNTTHGSLRPWNSWRTHTVLVQLYKSKIQGLSST